MSKKQEDKLNLSHLTPEEIARQMLEPPPPPERQEAKQRRKKRGASVPSESSPANKSP